MQVYFRSLLLASLFGSVSLPSFAQTPVTVATVQSRSLPIELRLNGNIVASREVDLAAEVAGQIAEVFVEQGDIVTAGHLLVRLRDAPIHWQLTRARAELQRDKAQVKLAELEQQRLQSLLQRQAIAKGSYDEAVARLQQAEADQAARQADIARLEDNLASYQIVAPFAGVISERPIEQGGWLGVGETVVHLASLEQLRLEIAVPQRFFQSLNQSSQPVEVSVLSDTQTLTRRTHIERIVPFADSTRSFQVWVAIDNKQRQWVPGMAATALLHWRDDISDGLTLPVDALVRRADGSTQVWKIDNSEQDKLRAVPVSVDVGHSNDGMLVVTSGELAAGDQVVVDGNEALQPQQWVAPAAIAPQSISDTPELLPTTGSAVARNEIAKTISRVPR